MNIFQRDVSGGVMTYTIMGRCDQTGQVGMALATVSLAVGGLCPFYTQQGDLISSQAYAQPRLGLEAVKLLSSGCSFKELQQRLENIDPFFNYRQIGIVKRSGEIFAYTGSNTRPWAGQAMGSNYLVMGNVLAGPQVLAAMKHAFNGQDGNLAERLLSAIEAGRNAGGQVNAKGEHCRERSAGLLVLSDESLREIDLRVDVHSNAVDELRRIFDIFKTYAPYNKLRAEDPPHTSPIADWEEEHLRGNPPPSAIG
jgi:uncharacterized Ntn-hydrolase superfamily protein